MAEQAKASVQNQAGGGLRDRASDREKQVFTLLDHMPDGIHTVLDAGLGDGYITDYILDKGKDVTAIGLYIETYGPDIDALKEKGLKLYESRIEKTPFEDGKFDAVVCSHILEHLPNTGEALQEVRRVLKDDGYLLLFIPAYEKGVVSGHINIGWNLGRLMYVLAINGFDAKNGQFIHYGQSLCAYVKKNARPVPPLRYGGGDLRMLAENDFFPGELKQTIIENDHE